MSNQYFKFKQFTINQDKTAMKVGTDGVLLGAWTDCNSVKSILDIGTGTGLIALMLAQKSDAKIVAIEKNQDAYKQAFENVENSKWKDRISIIFSDFSDFAKQSNEKFDLIVSNPPYFVNSLKNPNKNKTEARHNDSLPYETLIEGINLISHSKTIFNLIIPAEQKEKLIQISNDFDFHCNKITYVKPNIEKLPKRVLMSFSKNKTDIFENSFAIETTERHCYTEEYKKLTKDYYLAF